MDNPNQTVPAINLFVFAHNEQAHIESCLKSLLAATQNLDIKVQCYVLANGCSDDTFNVTQAFIQNHPQLLSNWSVIDIKIGDKSNTWNVAVHDYLTEQNLSFFVDGDCTISENSIYSIYQQYLNNPNYYAYSAYPATQGRDYNFITENTYLGEGLSGNFYALSPLFLNQVIETGFKLPLGLIGDDSLLSWICKTGLSPTRQVTRSHICPVPTATYHYHRLIPNSYVNIKSYFTRLQRYSMRHMQQECIREYMGSDQDFLSLPENIAPLYAFLQKSFIRYDNPICYIFDRWAFSTIKKGNGDAK